ncbi:MAG: FmdB family zinc ribbon protein [Pseudohongiellaceae bacterium]|jgi:putative FmdB family regulatory protein
MPIYEYKCRNCGNLFEKIVKLNESPDCPECDSSDLEKQFTVAAVSTSKTRAKSFQTARARANSVKKEQDVAQREYERKHLEDHH